MLRWMALVIAASGLLAGQTTGEEIDRLLTWLPEDTETVVVGQRPAVLNTSDVADGEQGVFADDLLRGYAISMLVKAQGGAIPSALIGSRLRFTLIAGRRFARHPRPVLGLIRNQSCAFYGLEDPLKEHPFTHGDATGVEGRAVQVSKATPYVPQNGFDDPGVDHFTTLLEPDLMLVCNHRGFLATVLRRKQGTISNVARRALPDSLPEWRHVDRSADYWGLRHLDEARRNDPTDPRNSGSDYPAPGAVGVTMSARVTLQTVRSVWLSASEQNPWREILAEKEFEELATTGGSASEGWWLESKDRGAGFGAFVLMDLLGYRTEGW